MRASWFRVLVLSGFILPGFPVEAATFLPLTPEQRIEVADAICRGTVVQVQCYRQRFIYTRTLVRVDEALKGNLPSVVELVHRGGVVDGEGEQEGCSPQLLVGNQRLFFLARRADGSFDAMPGGVSVTTSSVTGMLTDGAGIASRFLGCDRGEPIPYLVDAEALPAWITLTQATNAVRVAVQTWEAVTSLKFVFDGLQNFGQSARNVITNDGRIRIQLHDLYGEITNATTLSVGGRGFSFDSGLFPGGGLGGRVGPNEFHRTTRGFVVIKHTATAFQTLSTLEEVLCHEIGHTLSLAHSSEDPDEPDPLLAQAIMYFRIHADNRGATLGSYDPPIVQQAHPPGNTPPYGYDRVIYGVTYSSPITHPEVNQVEMKGYDLQGATLSRTLTNADGSGSWSALGDTVTFTPSGLTSGPPLDPADSGYYTRVYARFDDGTNGSPFVVTRVIALLPDTKPTGAPDGVPDGWMTDHFASTTPVPGVSGADDDPDGDGASNVREFQSDSDPNDASSCFRVTSFDGQTLQWQGRPYELYEAQTSTNLSTWSRMGNPLLVSNQIGSVTWSNGGSSNQFLRIRKVP